MLKAIEVATIQGKRCLMSGVQKMFLCMLAAMLASTIFSVSFAGETAVRPGDEVTIPAGTELMRKVKGTIIKTSLVKAAAGTVLKAKATVVEVKIPEGTFWVKRSAVTVAQPRPVEPTPAPAVETPTPVAREASSPPAVAPQESSQEGRSLVFLPLVSDKFDAKELTEVNGNVEQVLRKAFGAGVVSQAEVLKLAQFGDESERFSCVENQQCVAQLTQKLNADLVCSGTIGQVGNRYVVTIFIFDGRAGITASRTSKEAGDRAAVATVAQEAAQQSVAQLSVAGTQMKVSLADLGRNPKIAVMDFQGTGVDAALARSITDVVAAELKQFSGLQIISRQEIATLLSFEETKQGLGCSDEGCFVEIGNALGSSHLLAGSVGLLNDVYIISIKVIDIRKVKVVGRDQEYFKGPPDGLLPASRFVVRRVFGAPFEGDGLMKITVNAQKARVTLDGASVGEYPDVKVPETLAVGKHQVSVEHKDYYPLTQDVYVEPARRTQVDLLMTRMPTPWYKTWWFWTVVGALVAGGVTTGAVLGAMDGGAPDTGSGRVQVTGW